MGLVVGWKSLVDYGALEPYQAIKKVIKRNAENEVVEAIYYIRNNPKNTHKYEQGSQNKMLEKIILLRPMHSENWNDYAWKCNDNYSSEYKLNFCDVNNLDYGK